MKKLTKKLSILNAYINFFILKVSNFREASNIYAKPIIKGESKYRITEEEKQAIQIAMQK